MDDVKPKDDAQTLDENAVEALFDQAMALQQRGDSDQAEYICRHVLTHAPDHPPSRRILGLLCLQRGAVDEAVAHLEQFLTLRPEHVAIRFLLANTLMVQQTMERAVGHFRALLQVDPTHAEAAYHLGLALYGQGKIPDAIQAFRQALDLPDADRPRILTSLAKVLGFAAQYPEAEQCYRTILALEPDNHSVRYALGLLLQDMGQTQEATRVFKSILEAEPHHAAVWNSLAILFRKEGFFEEAEAHYRTALGIKPDFFEAWNNLGILLGDMGCVREAVDAFRQALAINPDSATVHSNLIMNLHYLPESDAAGLLAESRAYHARHARPLARHVQPHGNDRAPHRRLRIGYLSSDFRQHPVGFFWQPVMAAHDKRQFEIFCYSGVAKEDWITQRIQGWADHWRPIRGIDDATLAQTIREDGIDILADLAGHTEGNRLPLLARRPAPVQLTAGGHCNTTGLDAIDYLVCDAYHAPPGAESEFSETPLRMPDGYICYAPPFYAPGVTELPAREHGHITFGCFNSQIKVTQAVAALWSQILHRVPGSRLILRAGGMDDMKTRSRYLGWFQSQAIDENRLQLAGRLPHLELLAAYGAVDVALDPFPYSGGLTTLEALWMGVPVVTMTGRTFCGRHSTSHLSHAGLPWLVARSPEEYMDIVLKLVNDLEGLTQLRRTLRTRMDRSPLCDGTRYTRNLEAAYRTIWQKWCASAR
ncbi:MAG: tetratricopeptide repeat protein [Magnetococcales bacterium]|nr:tetratricopeptide repeat protein [Magnetococcales bacterium]